MSSPGSRGSDTDEDARGAELPPPQDMTPGTPSGEVMLRRRLSDAGSNGEVVGSDRQQEETSFHSRHQNYDQLLDEVADLRHQLNEARQRQEEARKMDEETSNIRDWRRDVRTDQNTSGTHPNEDIRRVVFANPAGGDRPDSVGFNNRQSSSACNFDRFYEGYNESAFHDNLQPRPRLDVDGNQPILGVNTRNPTRPATYNGKTSWRDYLVHFELVSELNGWDDEVKALELAVSLRDLAQSVLSDLRPDQRRSFDRITDALAARFEPENQSELYRSQLKNRLRKRGESLTELSQDVKRLTNMAYPVAPIEVREQLARDCFVDALNDADMEWAVHQGKPKSVEEATCLALEYEAFRSGRKGKSTLKPQVRMQCDVPGAVGPDATLRPGVADMAEVNRLLENISGRLDRLEKSASTAKCSGGSSNGGRGQRGRSGRCHHCSQEGHWRSECPIRQREFRRNGNGQRGHPRGLIRSPGRSGNQDGGLSKQGNGQ